LLTYLILATQFKSYLQPLIILSAIMFDVTGVAVNNPLILLDFINRPLPGRQSAPGSGNQGRPRASALHRWPPSPRPRALGMLPIASGIPSYSLI